MRSRLQMVSHFRRFDNVGKTMKLIFGLNGDSCICDRKNGVILKKKIINVLAAKTDLLYMKKVSIIIQDRQCQISF